MLHQAKNGMVMDMTQLKDRENELGNPFIIHRLVTCGINTPILFWDIDVVEPTQSIETGQRLNAIKISPDGRLLACGSDTGEVI
jgi:WD40 repeat protein